jgi:hypothetical protein
MGIKGRDMGHASRATIKTTCGNTGLEAEMTTDLGEGDLDRPATDEPAEDIEWGGVQVSFSLKEYTAHIDFPRIFDPNFALKRRLFL